MLAYSILENKEMLKALDFDTKDNPNQYDTTGQPFPALEPA